MGNYIIIFENLKPHSIVSLTGADTRHPPQLVLAAIDFYDSNPKIPVPGSIPIILILKVLGCHLLTMFF